MITPTRRTHDRDHADATDSRSGRRDGLTTIRPTRRTCDIAIDGARLVNVPHAELASELAAAIREHRARLSAAVAEEEKEDE